ncbi:MAG: cytidylate kinase-like family protein, partial [Deltaproteobacteria bacterium]|nr:cytidylate kinase-like family protein [Deltaproteobacteria bacterium]
EPGSGGRLIADELAKRLNFTLFDKNILTTMANMAAVESKSLDTIEQQRPSGIQDFITSLVDNNYVYTGDYVSFLKQQVEIIGKLGRGVIVGRGANFILPPKDRFSIRIIAPLDIRIRNVSFRNGVSLAEAKKRIRNREQRRKTFIRETFHEDIADIMHYDLILNTARMDLETAVESVIGAIVGSQAHRTFEKETSYILKGKR